MRIVNETGQEVFYGISCANSSDCGTIDVDGYVDLPSYDNQTDVSVSVTAAGGNQVFALVLPETGTGQQVEMAVVVE